MAAIDSENMGMGKETDFLTVSFSTPDYTGHAFGAQSKEIEDVYLRLDKNMEELLLHLDKKLGIGNYTVFLSADHGVAEIPAFLKKHNVPAGLFLGGELEKKAEAALIAKFGEGKYVINSDNYQLYLNKVLLAQKNITVDQVTAVLKNEFATIEGVYNVINLSEGNVNEVPSYYRDKLTNIYNPKRSGEVMILVEPAWFQGYTKGTTHGTMYAYDTHVPLVFYGWGINKGEKLDKTYISDIAPTIAMLLKIFGTKR